ncbi:MAG: tetratricopeptide repeat protein [Candidatus Omnitrophota bacterium]
MNKSKLTQPKISFRQKIILIISGIFFFAILLEAGLGLGGFIVVSLQEYKNRIAIKQKGTYRIICLGESTTFWGGRDPWSSQDSWPSQLEEILNQRNIGIKFTVINKGVCGTCTAAIVARLEDNLNQYQPDMVITMMGINDREGAIAYADIPAPGTRTLFNSLRSYKLIKLLKLHIISKAKELGIYKPREIKEAISSESIEEPQLAGFKEQEEIYKRTMAASPRDDKAYAALGWCYRQQGKYTQAEAMLRKAIELNPQNEWADIELGWCYRDQGKHDQAVEMFKKAIEVNPQNVSAYGDLARCYKDQRKYTQAEEIYKKAIEIAPRNDRAYAGLAHCYKEQGKSDLAEEYTRKVNKPRLEYYNPITRNGYQKLKEILTNKGIQLVCAQYPVRSLEPLKQIFEDQEGVIFVSNERVFKQALKQASYKEYFTDMFAGDFGHCTPKGNKLLAENIANVILKEYFNLRF